MSRTKNRPLPIWLLAVGVGIAVLWLDVAGVIALGGAPPRNPGQHLFVVTMMTVIFALAVLKQAFDWRRQRAGDADPAA